MKDSYRETALLMASSRGRTRTVSLLLDRGADVIMKDNDGKSALTRAHLEDTQIYDGVIWGHTETVPLLLARSAC